MSSGFRLQTFAPGAPAASSRAADLQRELEAARDDAYRRGFVDGQADATESFLADQTRLTSELIEALNDARMTNEAARRHVGASLGPMIAALCRAIAPAIASAGLAAEIGRLVERAAAAAPGARPRLRCSPEVAPKVRALLEDRGLEAEIEEAPELLPREAQVFWDQGFDQLDLDACIAQVEACLASHLKPNHEGDDDDPKRLG